jgi:isopentenyl-diphosphate Delta-isomerase
MPTNALDLVVLVDEHDSSIGSMEKLEAHQKGVLHRAFSVFVFNDENKLLIHRRASGKYHSAGLWTNTCCSHPRPGESNLEAATRRLHEEMGFTCDLHKVNSFIYRAEFENGLIEHELDHICIGHYNEDPIPNPEEVAEWKYISISELQEEMQREPSKYTVWFQLALPVILEWKRNTNLADQ